MYEFTFQLEEIYILITGSSVSVPQLVCCCGNEVGCCCALSSRDDPSADNTSPIWVSSTYKCNRHRNPLISAEICLKYQQGVSCHPRIIWQIWSLKNIKHILNTVHRTRSVSDCHSTDKLSVLDGIPVLISILIMGILSLMVWLCFMAFQEDGEAICGITQTYVIRSHAAPLLTKKAKTITDEGVVDVLLTLWSKGIMTSGLTLWKVRGCGDGGWREAQSRLNTINRSFSSW